MMVGFILTSVLLLVLPSLICGTTTRINVTDSGSLQLSSFPDNLTISDSLNVTCIYTGKDKPGANDLRLNIKVTDNLLTPLYYEDNKKIGYDMEADSYTKNVQVTFSSSSGQMALQEQPIRVTVSTSFHDISVEVTSNITDNRGKHELHKALLSQRSLKVVIPEVCKIGKILYVHLYREKWYRKVA